MIGCYETLMKKMFVVGAPFLNFMKNTCYAIDCCKDVLERGSPGGPSASLKIWAEELAMDGPAEVDGDIWINDVPEKLITAGIYLAFDWSQMSSPSTEI